MFKVMGGVKMITIDCGICGNKLIESVDKEPFYCNGCHNDMSALNKNPQEMREMFI
jgi:hypothetical protein